MKVFNHSVKNGFFLHSYFMPKGPKNVVLVDQSTCAV